MSWCDQEAYLWGGEAPLLRDNRETIFTQISMGWSPGRDVTSGLCDMASNLCCAWPPFIVSRQNWFAPSSGQ